MANISPTITDDYSSYKYYFANFESKQDLEAIGAKDYAASPSSSQTKNTWNDYTEFNPSFVGTRNRAEVEKGEFLEYIDKDLLTKNIDSFEELFAKIDMGGAFDKARLIITDDKRGIFDFGIASKGLYRPQEYYSAELALESPLEFPQKPSGVVPFDFTTQDVFNQFWYTSRTTQKKYLLTAQQEGTRAIELNAPNAKLVFKTTVKKAYVMFERKGGKARLVDLYVGVGGLADLTKEGMLARAMPLLLAARYFEMAGIKTRINATRMYRDERKSIVGFTYPIKDYGQDIDFNWIAINTADPRWFRWNLWKYVSAILGQRFKFESIGSGSTVYGGELLLETFNRYKNWYFEQMQAGKQPEIRVDRNLMIAGGLSNPSNSVSANKEEIVKEFFRILDIVDFQFNKPEKAAERIYKRMVEDQGKSIYEFKRYVQTVLPDAYSYPERGEYATEREQQDKLTEELDVAIEGLNNYLLTKSKN